ncbi:hypothetical protein [Actinomadura sp. KC06]|uniref:hypothetical protein n=1 Tax=Actinomadura sp. KC06 TaxID=2530369 RepID=UPI0014047A1D|nr:hypothetical protein [Actinomadura sp. KC06]
MTQSERMDEVDVNPGVHQPTEADEGQVLGELYGEPNTDGFFQSSSAAPAEEDGEEDDR